MIAISAGERERYLRQVLIPSWGEEAQGRLKAATVFVAGAGGLGSSAILYLAAAGVGCIRVCDRGRVELSNLNRQILHGEWTTGTRKSSSARRAVARLNRHVRVVSLFAELTQDNVVELAAGAHLLLDCLDSVPDRMILNSLSVKARIPLVHAGVRALGGQLTFLRPPATPCLACFLREPSPEAGSPGPAEQPLPILGAVAGAMGCLQALEALKYLAGVGECAENRILFFDGETMSFESVPVARSPDCPVCGPSAGLPA
jgi:molybdopterin-synthase adenylyltransferase